MYAAARWKQNNTFRNVLANDALVLVAARHLHLNFKYQTVTSVILPIHQNQTDYTYFFILKHLSPNLDGVKYTQSGMKR